ncbi:Oidioi.mRNA.OKI2018_I69.chr1.g2855.t1.cds [Oikopleura dioica]|uniref:Oidioi.mRNA.OKI2018_I69.chr1.g2855.t1.cds n=1 Tax=Oikopleura dioica TaxID=34765 RepID=A0ABN7SSA3_OIKDI|nr:Oidioi.mRNA.OKI2018_I69.chr1.g2855.t1.cds [Oikopleura dioica]
MPYSPTPPIWILCVKDHRNLQGEELYDYMREFWLGAQELYPTRQVIMITNRKSHCYLWYPHRQISQIATIQNSTGK